ncbi:MAG: major capsid protein [Microviridae sp.]|nr:MAG: major capsid protein [Microviridae sp.]
MRDMVKQVSENLLMAVPQKSRHNIDSQTLTTSGFGTLTPVYIQEAVPGGQYTLSAETLVRFQPLASPLMHKCTTKIFYFYVPYRILWHNWEHFVMGKPDPLTGLDPVFPYYPASYYSSTPLVNGVNQNRLADYLGIKVPPTGSSQNLNPMAFAAYQKIYNRYFRHKALKTESFSPDTLNDGLLSPTNFVLMSTLQKITYEDDYFNQALPTPQKGDPIFIDDNSIVRVNDDSANSWKIKTLLAGGNYDMTLPDNPPGTGVRSNVPALELYADVKIAMEELRVANAMQKFVEAERHTHTYKDYHKMMFNSNIKDDRVQDAEYITGHTQPITISDVVNTADLQGRLTSTGDSYFRADGDTYYTPEHGLIMGIAVTTYSSAYMKALPKVHLKTDRFEYFHPAFDNLGEQKIIQAEINGLQAGDTGTFGYVPKHHEYRKSWDMITGEMATTYAHWHLARNYAGGTGLTSTFHEVLDERRIFVYTDDDYDAILYQVYNNVSALLPMGDMSVPTL